MLRIKLEAGSTGLSFETESPEEAINRTIDFAASCGIELSPEDFSEDDTHMDGSVVISGVSIQVEEF